MSSVLGNQKEIQEQGAFFFLMKCYTYSFYLNRWLDPCWSFIPTDFHIAAPSPYSTNTCITEQNSRLTEWMLFRHTKTRNLVLSVRILGEWGGVVVDGFLSMWKQTELGTVLSPYTRLEMNLRGSEQREVRWNGPGGERKEVATVGWGRVCVTGERLSAQHHPESRGGETWRSVQSPGRVQFLGVWNGGERMGSPRPKKDESRGKLPFAFRMGCYCAHSQPGAGDEESRDPLRTAQVTCLSCLPQGLHFRRLRVTTGYRGTCLVT